MNNPRDPLHAVFWLLPCGMLLLALAPWPYDYYKLLRLVVCGCAVFLIYRIHAREKTAWLVALSAIAVLFNPLLGVHLTREVWAVLNVLSAILLACRFFMWRKAFQEESKGSNIAHSDRRY